MSRPAKLRWTFATLTFWISLTTYAQMGLRTAKPEEASDDKSSTNFALTAPVEAEAATTCGSMKFKGLFPTTSKESWEQSSKKTSCFWDLQGQEYLKYSRFTMSSKGIATGTDIMTDAFGPIRVAVSAAVAASKDKAGGAGAVQSSAEAADKVSETQDKTLNLLKANGGNLAVTGSLAVLFKKIGEGSFRWNSYMRLAGNVPALGSSSDSTIESDDLNGNIELAFTELNLDLLGYEKHFNILGYVKASGIGGTRKFREALGKSADGLSDKKIDSMFFHGVAGAGLRLTEKMSIFFTYNWYSDSDIPGQGGALSLVFGK